MCAEDKWLVFDTEKYVAKIIERSKEMKLSFEKKLRDQKTANATHLETLADVQRRNNQLANNKALQEELMLIQDTSGDARFSKLQVTHTKAIAEHEKFVKELTAEKQAYAKQIISLKAQIEQMKMEKLSTVHTANKKRKIDDDADDVLFVAEKQPRPNVQRLTSAEAMKLSNVYLLNESDAFK